MSLYPVPSHSPSGLTIHHIVPSTAKLSWIPVPNDEVITGYNVQVIGLNSNSVQEIPVEGSDATSVEISNLIPLTNYTFKVSAKSQAGSGPAASISAIMPEGGEIIYLTGVI